MLLEHLEGGSNHGLEIFLIFREFVVLGRAARNIIASTKMRGTTCEANLYMYYDIVYVFRCVLLKSEMSARMHTLFYYTNGSFDKSGSVELKNIQLPEFVNGIVVGGVEARLFHSSGCKYDIIFGQDFLWACQLKLCFHTNNVNWFGVKLDMKPVNHCMIDNVIDI